MTERTLEEQALLYQFELKMNEASNDPGFSWPAVLDLMFWAYSQGINDH